MLYKVPRNDLTSAERKAFAAGVGRILAKMIEDGQSGEMAKTTGMPFKTLQNWWKSFCQASNREMTPKQASDEDVKSHPRRRPHG